MPRKPDPTRRTQVERAQSTQQKLIKEAINLLKKKRYAGFRTAEVAELAGMSKGAQTHHFPTKDTLVLEALEAVYQKTQKQALERIKIGSTSSHEILHQMMEDARAFFLSDDFLLSLDLMMVDPGSPLGSDVKILAQKYRVPVENAWLEALIAAGQPATQAKDVVRLTFAIARGFAIRQLITGPNDEFDQLMTTWTRMAEAMLLFSSSQSVLSTSIADRPADIPPIKAFGRRKS